MNPSAGHFVFCPCGADNPSDAKICWLCLRELPGVKTPDPGSYEVGASETSPSSPVTSVWQPSVPSSPTATSPGWPASEAPFALPTLALWMTLAVVGLGVFIIAPGLALILAIGVMPALVRTALVVGRRSKSGEQIPNVEKVLLFLGSLGTSVVVAVVVLVASVGSFCAVCLTSGKQSAVPVAILVAVVVTGGVLFFLWKWIRHRWQRDV